MATLARDGGPKVRATPFPTVADASGRTLGEEELAAVADVLRSGRLNRTVAAESRAEELETGFGAWLGRPHVVASSSGTAAIHLAIAAIDPEPGDEIVVPPITDFGTVIPVLSQNAVPVFADVDPATWCLDPVSVERNMTSRTRAIVAVHLFGRPADLDGLLDVARRHAVPLIEDCCQAYGATFRDRKVGTFGELACFSLQQSKHITCGDGGLTVTTDPDLARRMRLFGDKGWPRDGDLRTHLFLGLNYRMTELQAAVALAQLAKLDGVIARRQGAGRRLADLLRGLPGITVPALPEGSASVYWLFPVNVDAAALGVSVAELSAAIVAEGIPAQAGYVRPLYLAPALAEGKTYGRSAFPFDSPYTTRRHTDYRPGLCPVAEGMSEAMFTVPINERFTEHDVRDVAAAIEKVVCHYAARRGPVG
jgi:dTDP-4-amino-4,6-dideoxygalactose transaminase